MAVVSLLVATLQSFFPAVSAAAQSPDLKVSMLTCYPGAEVFNLCGHSAIRIHNDAGLDSVWNFGIFDFRAPHFVYRFVKGETDYMAGGEPTEYFVYPYTVTGRKVVEQDLNLNQEEAQRLLAALRHRSLPENRVYRYNYVRDNCATRVEAAIEQALDTAIIFHSHEKYGTWRNEMRAYHKNYPWYQFGIDLILGSGLDHDADSREERFVPLEMMEQMATAQIADGRPLVTAERVIYPGRPDATLPPTPWWLTPLLWSCVAALLAAICIFYEVRTGRIVKWANSLWFLITGTAGLLVFFMVFVSEHEASSPNMLIWWLNPLGLVVAVMVWWSRLAPVTRWLMAFIAVCASILAFLWPFQLQSTDTAVFPLMFISIGLAMTYAILGDSRKFKKNTPGARKKGAGTKDRRK